MARSAEDVFNSLSAKYETDRADRITAKKEASISFAAEQKKQALDPEYQARMLVEDQAKWKSRDIPEGGFEDADTTVFQNPAFENGVEKLRHAADQSLGYSVDAFEVPHNDEPFSQEKFLRQQEMLGRNLNIPAQDVTKEMIFKKGEEQRQAYMAAAREGFEPGQEINTEFRDYGKGYFGRTLSGVRNPQTGQDLVDMFNTPEENAGYYQLYNAGKRVEDTKKAYDLARSKRDRTGGEIAGDAGADLTKFALDTSGMVYGAADLLTGGNLDKVAKLAPEYAKARQYIDDNWLSDPTKASKRRVAQSGAKRAAESKARMDKLKESGEYSFLEHGLKEQTGSAWEALKSYIDEPLALLDEVLTTAPQILTGSLVAKQAVGIAIKQATKGMTKKQAATWAASDAGKAVVAKAGERAAIGYTGLQEGMSNSVHAKGVILEKSHETLMSDSEEYRKMIAAGTDPDVARRRLADDTARVVALVAGTIGIASSKITGAGKAEANLFNKGLGKTAIARNTKKIVGGGAREGGEETLQGIGGQFAENLAAKLYTKDDQDLSEGTGQAAGQGLALGLASGGGMQAIGAVPAAIGGTAAEVATGVGKKVEARRSTVRAKAEGDLTEVTNKTKSSYDPKVAVAAYAKAYSTADTKEKKQKYLSDINDIFAEQIQATNKAETEKGINSPEYKAAKQESDETGITLGNLLNSNKADNSTAVAQSIKALSDIESDSFGSEDIDNVINNISQGTSDIANYQSILNNPSKSPELAQVKRIIEAAKTVESLKPASRRVKTEVLGPDINNWGRAGLANHIAGIHMAIKSNNDVGTQDRIEALEEFVAKQERKVRIIEEGWDKAEAENWSTDGGKRTVTWPLTGGKTWTYEIRPGSKIHAKKNIDPEIAYIKAELDLTKQMAAQKFGTTPPVTVAGSTPAAPGGKVETPATEIKKTPKKEPVLRKETPEETAKASKYPDPKTTDSDSIKLPSKTLSLGQKMSDLPRWVQNVYNVYNAAANRPSEELPGVLKTHHRRLARAEAEAEASSGEDTSFAWMKVGFVEADLHQIERIMRLRGIGFPKEFPDSQKEYQDYLDNLTPAGKINIELMDLQQEVWYLRDENNSADQAEIAKLDARITELKAQLKAILDKTKKKPTKVEEKTKDMKGLIYPGKATTVRNALRKINDKKSLGAYVNNHLNDSSPIKPIFNRMLDLMLDSTVIVDKNVTTDENIKAVWDRKSPDTLGWYGLISGGSSYMSALSFDSTRHKSVEAAIRTLVHEVGHGALLYTISGVEENKSWVTKEQKAAVARLEQIYNYVKDNVTVGDTQKYNIQYSLTDKHEFISEAYSNLEVQNWLSTMELPGSNENVFVAFVKTVAELFGFNKDDSNVMMAMISIGDDLFNTSESHFESKNKKASTIDMVRRKVNDLQKEQSDNYASLMKLFVNDVDNTREIEGYQLRQREVQTEIDKAQGDLKKAIGVVDPSPYFSNLDETKSIEVKPEVLSPMAAALAKVKKDMPADAVKKSAEGAKKRAKETIGDIRRRRVVERAHEEEDPEAISIVQKEIEKTQISLRQRAYNVNTELNDILAAHFGVESEQAPVTVNEFQKKYPSDAQPKKAADFEADLAKIQPFLDRYGQYNPEGKNWLEKAYRAIKKTPVYGKLEELGKVHITDPIAQWDRELIIEGFMEQLTADNSNSLEPAVQKAVFDFYNQYSVRPTSVQTNVEPSRRRLGEYLGEGKGDYSIYSYIPNFFTNWNAAETKAKLKSLLNIKDENSKTVDTLSKFNTQFGQALNEVIETETYIGAREKTDAVLRFLNASNVLPENLVSAMSTSLFNYMGTRGGKTTSLDDRGINNLFGRKSDYTVEAGQKTLLRGAGGFARPMALELGRMIRKQLNLGPVTSLDGTWIDKLDYSLGMLAFAAARNPSFDYEGQNVPLVVMNSVTQGELNQFRTPDEIAAIKDPKATINFIRFAHFEMSEENTEIPTGINALMTEQTKEFSSVFESLFDLKGYTDEPTSKPKKTGPVQVQGTIQETSEHLRDGAAANQQVAWGVKNTWVNLTNKLSKLNFLEMGDHIRDIDQDVHVTQRAHVKAVNDDLARDLYAINEFIDSNPKELTEEFFFKFIAQRNGRNGNTSTTINPTLKKMHRFFFGAKKWVQTIDRTDRAQMINYKIAVMAGLGMETNKFMPGELITAYTEAFGKDVKEGVYNYRPAVEALKKGIADKGSLKKKEQRAIVDAVKKAGEKYHSLDALIAVATSEIALDQNKKTFTVDIGREIDGTTNGVISSIMQLTPDVELAKTILRAGGYLFKGDIEQAYAEWIRHPKNRDNYQQLTIRTRTALDKLKTNLLANTQPGPLQQDEQNKFDALQTIMGNLVERNIETGIEEVTKAGRLLHKYPLMIAAYGASIERIVRELSALVIDDFYDQLMHGTTPEGFTEAQRVAKLLWQVEVLTTRPNTRHTKQQIMDLVVNKKLDTKAGIREFEISFGKTKRFEDAISQYYGVALEDSLHKQLGEFMVNRAWINGAIRVMNEVFVTLYNNRLSKFEKKNDGRPASREEKTEIMEQLRDAGYLPGMAHASSTDVENYRDHLQLTQTETVDLPGASNNVKQQYGKKLPVNMLSLNADKELDIQPEQFESTSSQMKEEVFKRDTGVSPYPTGNIANDGNVQAFLMKHFDDMLNLFDASMNGIANVDASSAMANQSYDNLHAQYSMADEVKRTLERLLKANQKVPNDYGLTYDKYGGASYSKDTVQGSLLDNPIVIQGARDTLGGESIPKIAFNKLDDFLYGIHHKDGTHTDGYYDNYETVKQNYKAIQDSRVSVEQFTNPGSAFQVPGRAVQRKGESKEAFGRRLWNDVEQEAVITQEQTPDIQNDEDTEILGSDFFAGRTRDAVMHKFDELNTTSAQRIFNELEIFGNQPETPEHRNYLQSVLDDFIQPAMGKLDSVLIHRGMSRSQNQGWIQGENIYVAAAEGIITAESNMSTQEVYVHELFHAIWSTGINNDQEVRGDIAKLWRIAKKHMSPVDFLERNNNGSVKIAPGSILAEEMRFAEDRYNYIFDGPGNSYLHEFATMGMTNANFRNKLLAISNRPERVAGSDNYVSVLSNAFMKIVDWIATFGNSKKKATVGDALTQLAKNIEGVHNNGDNIIDKAFLKFAELNTPARKAFVDYMLRPYVKHVVTRLAKPGRSTIAKGIDNVIRMPYDLLSGNYREAVTNAAYANGFVMDNVVHKLLTEITGPTNLTQPFHTLLRIVKQAVDFNREREAKGLSNQVKARFLSGTPDTEEMDTLGSAYLDTDLSTLLPYHGAQDIVSFLNSDVANNAQISKLEGELRRTYGRQAYNFYKIQANSLGFMMITGQAGIERQLLNPHNIARMSTTGQTPSGDLKKAEELIDQLATHYAIKRLDRATKKVGADRMEAEYNANNHDNGVSFALMVHTDIKKRALAESFRGNKALMMKGYVQEQFNPNRGMMVGTKADEKAFNKDGYFIKGEIKRDKYATGTIQLYLYITKSNPLNKKVSGITSNTDKIAMGAGLTQIYSQNTNVANPVAAAHKQRSILNMKTNVGVAEQFDGTAQLDYDGNFMIPTVNESEEITDYRYIMRENSKRKYLGKTSELNVTLGRMSAGILDKKQTSINNEKFFKLTKLFFDEEYAKDPRKFVAIGPNVADPKHREFYHMLPSDSKRIMKDVWGPKETMYVREDLLGISFGFHKLSFTDWAWKHKVMQILGDAKTTKYISRITGDIWQAIVAAGKRNTVLLFPAILKANVLSNFLISMVYKGVPPTFLLREQLNGARYMIEYSAQQKEIDNLDRLIKVDPKSSETPARIRKRNRLESHLKLNPVRPLIKAGIFQSIIEDIDENDSSLKGVLSGLLPEKQQGIVDKWGEVIPESVKTVYREGIIAPDTELGNVLLKATQYSDFVARYALHKWNTEKKGMAEEDSINDIVRTFVDYDNPTSPELQWINDMGMRMYTKFLFRMIRPFVQGWMESPLSNVVFEMSQQLLGDVSDPGDTIMGIMNQWHFPGSPAVADNAFELSWLHQMNWIPGVETKMGDFDITQLPGVPFGS